MTRRIAATAIAFLAMLPALGGAPTAHARWGAVPVAAATQQPAINVSATVVGKCSSVTPNPGTITFGNYDPITYPSGTPLYDNTAVTLSANCTTGDAISWTVGDGGNCNKGGTANERAMTDNAGHYLSYILYHGSNGTGGEWDTNSCGTPAAQTDTGKGSSTANTIAVYGAIPGGLDAPVGSYSDTITVTLNY